MTPILTISKAEAMNPSRRNTMEDVHVSHAPGEWGCNDKEMAFVGVYDGHGGRDTVDFLEGALHRSVAEELNTDDEAPIQIKIERAFLIADVECRMSGIETSGATVALCLIKRHTDGRKITIHAANAGDARAVLSCQPTSSHSLFSSSLSQEHKCTNKSSPKSKRLRQQHILIPKSYRLTFDHKSDDDEEMKRIENAGGFFIRNRVLGIMAVARSLGDHGMKSYIIGKPFVNTVEIDLDACCSVSNDDHQHQSDTLSKPSNDAFRSEFVIVACDGVWDVLLDQEACDLVRSHVNKAPISDKKKHMESAAKVICQEALERGRRLISNVPDSKKFQHGIISVKGFKPGINDWVNQDNFFVHEDTTDLKGGRHIYAVFDGHGRYGHDVSAFCSDELQGILEISEKYSNIIQGLQDALETSSIDIEASGTTATIIILQEDYVEVYNVGDSRAMIATNLNDDELGFGFETMPLTYEHTLDKPEEVERILSSGGNVSSKSVIIEDEKTVIQGPIRVWYKCTKDDSTSTMMGLAMTRSIGDAGAHRVGVSSEPYKNRTKITKQSEFIILGSDGIWDVISCAEAARVINEYIISLPPHQTREEWDPKEAAKLLVSRARRKWHGASHIDDITCCVIKLKSANGTSCFLSDSTLSS